MIPINQREEIKFFMPSTSSMPGIVLQEYELIIRPPVEVQFS